MNTAPLLVRYATLPQNTKYLLLASILLLIAIGYYLLSYIGEDSIQNNLQEQLTKLTREQTQKQQYVNELPKYETQYLELQNNLTKAKAQLPDADDVPQFLSQISGRAQAAGLTILRFEPRASQIVDKDFYAEIVFNMQVRGSYHEIGAFIDSVGNLDRIVNILDISLTNPRKEDKKILLDANFNVKTYRFVQAVTKNNPSKPANKP